MSSTEISPVIVTESSVDELRQRTTEEPGSVFAILDACDEERIPQKVSELGDRAVSLYRGWAQDQYWAIAPYLVVIDTDLLEWIVDNLWDDPWGIFIVAPPDLASLRKHFRRFLLVQTEEGKELYFRFYDPRVLSVFLPACTASELDGFFGPVRSFQLVSEESDTLLEFRLHQRPTADANADPRSRPRSADASAGREGAKP